MVGFQRVAVTGVILMWAIIIVLGAYNGACSACFGGSAGEQVNENRVGTALEDDR